jgi:transcriptional regulator with GAF, ATPase, and Fis domain
MGHSRTISFPWGIFVEHSLDIDNFFYQASLRILGSLKIEDALCKMVQYIDGTIPADSATLHLYEAKCGVMRVLARADKTKGEQLEVVVKLDKKAQRTAEWPFKERVKIISDTYDDPVGASIQEQTAIFGSDLEMSHMVLRLDLHGERVGDVALQAHGNDRYQSEHARMFEALSASLGIALKNFLQHQKLIELQETLQDECRFLRNELTKPHGQKIIGLDTGLKEVMMRARKVARLDTPVLLLGETGVGKELFVSAIQKLSDRADKPFIKVNCGAIPAELIDSELFGHEKGSFTGASGSKRGRFERAHTGTIFLDEIGELPLQAQVRLLRVLQQKEIERVGGEEVIPVDIRIIAATNRDLSKMVADGTFREDLYFRLSVFPIHIPPLRQRKQDIPALVDFFVGNKIRNFGYQEKPPLAPNAWDRLQSYDWPGNVRELENLVERELILWHGDELRFDDLSSDTDRTTVPVPLQDPRIHSLDEAMANHIQMVLKLAKGKIQGPGGAAEILFINPNTLRKRMRKLRIKFGREVVNSDD